MSFPLSSLKPIVPVAPLKPDAGVQPKAGAGFQDMLQQTAAEVQSLQEAANVNVQQFLRGENEEIHSVALSVQKADIAMEMLQQVRNKVVSAYQEIMRMQM